jgi:septal ring factor EnvC (AmiA/AmiB activator)
MAESPVQLEKVDCGNGKRRLVIREREYDMVSWHGLKTVTTVVVTIGGIIAAVLTAYYTAEASQNSRLDTIRQTQTEIRTTQQNNEKSVTTALEKIERALTEQHKVIGETRDTLIRVDTRQQSMKDQVEKLAEEIKKSNP